MDIFFRKHPGVLIVSVSGDIDHHTAETIKRMTERELYVTGSKNLIFDMSEVSFMDSSGIGMLIGRYKTVMALGGRTAVAAPSKEADRLMEMSGIYRIIKPYHTVDSALMNIGRE